MAKRAPAISVLMPVFNAERYLREAVESILAQTFPDFEFVIVDDGSTDGSLAVLEEYARREQRIVLISRPNTGIVGALNDGLARCHGEFIARMDADDIAMPDRLERQVAYLHEHPECVLLGTAVVVTDSEGAPLRVPEVVLLHEAIDERLLRGRGGAVAHPTAMMRREAVLAVGKYQREPVLEDLDLWLRLAERGRVANLPEPLLRYRRHDGSICSNQSAAQWALMERVVADAFHRRGSAMPKRWRLHRPPAAARHLEAGKAALRRGEYGTALNRTWRACLREPTSRATWKLLRDVARSVLRGNGDGPVATAATVSASN